MAEEAALQVEALFAELAEQLQPLLSKGPVDADELQALLGAWAAAGQKPPTAGGSATAAAAAAAGGEAAAASSAGAARTKAAEAVQQLLEAAERSGGAGGSSAGGGGSGETAPVLVAAMLGATVAGMAGGSVGGSVAAGLAVALAAAKRMAQGEGGLGSKRSSEPGVCGGRDGGAAAAMCGGERVPGHCQASYGPWRSSWLAAFRLPCAPTPGMPSGCMPYQPAPPAC